MGKEIKGKSPILLGAKAVVEPSVEEAKAAVPEELRALLKGFRSSDNSSFGFINFNHFLTPLVPSKAVAS